MLAAINPSAGVLQQARSTLTDLKSDIEALPVEQVRTQVHVRAYSL